MAAWQKYGRAFCSRDCYYEHRRLHPVRNFVQPEERTCPACGKVFLVGGEGRPPRDTKFCSRACAGNGRVRFAVSRTMKRYEASWLAGLFDGEGNIAKPRKTSDLSLRISITNTNYALLEQVLLVTGTGSITNHHEAIGNHSRSWNWQCHGENARSLLRQMLPWLIVKREKALVAMGDPPPKGLQ